MICAVRLGPVTAARPEALDAPPSEDPVWLHFNLSDKRARLWLEHAGLPAFAEELLLDTDPRIHLSASSDAVAAVLGDLHHDFDQDPEGFGTIRVFFDAKRFISARTHPLKTADRIRRELLRGAEMETTAALFEYLVESLANTFAAAVVRIGDIVDDAEDRILAGATAGQRKALGNERRLLVRLRRHVIANRAALAPLPARLPAFAGADARQHLRDAIDRLEAVAQDLELAQERARLLQEEIAGRLTEATNRNLFLLSIVTVALLPITLITGIFGMNVGGLPWISDPRGFWYVMSGVLTAVAVALALMHWRRVL